MLTRFYMGSKRCVQVRACCTEGLGGPAEGIQCCGMRGDASDAEFLLRQVRFSVLICSNVKEKKKRENESNMSECVCDLLSITLDFWTET